MMNNKGQVLVVFIILLPIVLFCFCMVVDLGILHLEKRTIDNNIKSTIKYGLKHVSDENIEFKMGQILKENIGDIDSLYIDVDDNKINITLVKRQPSFFAVTNLKANQEIKVGYTGYLKDDKIELIRK